MILSQSIYTPRDGLGSAGPQGISVFGAPLRCDLLGRLSQKRESMRLYVQCTFKNLSFVAPTLVLRLPEILNRD